MKKLSLLSVLFFLLLLPASASAKPELVFVPFSSTNDFFSLQKTGLDITENVTPAGADVLLRSKNDENVLRAAGLTWQTRVSDLAEKNLEERSAAPPAFSPLPSSRKSYRVYDDYVREMTALAENNPGLVRLLQIGTTREGEKILGLEIAKNVASPNGRPVFAQFGLHHAREWPSGEMPMEFALDMVRSFKAGNNRVVSALTNARLLIFPVVNVDGFRVSRGSGATRGGSLLASSLNEYRRKNCRPLTGEENLPCALRKYAGGVDLNRNYGYYWGGGGTSSDWRDEQYKGPSAVSEPETQAVHNLSRQMQITTLITHHTYTPTGSWLRQPGFYSKSIFSPNGDIPDEELSAELGDAFEAATGWPTSWSWELYDVTGATEDWNYMARGTLGYTPEGRGNDFHGRYIAMVIAAYPGMREALLRAAEAAAEEKNHGVISGTAPPGSVLHIKKSFLTPTCSGWNRSSPCLNPTPTIPENISEDLIVPQSGNYSWHLNPSSRPLVEGEKWTISCSGSAEQTFSLTRGESKTLDWSAENCGSARGGEYNSFAFDENWGNAPLSLYVAGKNKMKRGTDVLFLVRGSQKYFSKMSWDLDGDGKFDDGRGSEIIRAYKRSGKYQTRVRIELPNSNIKTLEKTIRIRKR